MRITLKKFFLSFAMLVFIFSFTWGCAPFKKLTKEADRAEAAAAKSEEAAARAEKSATKSERIFDKSLRK